MAKYAIIRTKGSQYKVSEGDVLLIDKLASKEKPEAEVLLVKTDKGVKIGKPKVRGAKVTLKVEEEEVKGKKLHVKTFKAKSRYRRHIGFRPKYSKVKVTKIS